MGGEVRWVGEWGGGGVRWVGEWGGGGVGGGGRGGGEGDGLPLRENALFSKRLTKMVVARKLIVVSYLFCCYKYFITTKNKKKLNKI